MKEDRNSNLFSPADLFARLFHVGKYRRERRKFPRRKKVYIAELEFKNRKKTITVTNLSKEGIGVCVDEKLEPGTLVDVIFSHEFQDTLSGKKKIRLILPATVVWSKKVFSKGIGLKDYEAGDEKSVEYDMGLKLDQELLEESKKLYDDLLAQLRKEDMKTGYKEDNSSHAPKDND
ncbi:MAG: PilZ domain-containing protein [Candidatus Aureabacteria bacterium]|nr:PilZ domain-containing protein [Candidatus Auribacterota bacterium]